MLTHYFGIVFKYSYIYIRKNEINQFYKMNVLLTSKREVHFFFLIVGPNTGNVKLALVWAKYHTLVPPPRKKKVLSSGGIKIFGLPNPGIDLECSEESRVWLI